ncbi:MAG: cupin domain-containing protein [Hyphomicrobiales bacterium]|nr:cupin domain-containing protein [Hyphomicrobiales bacterium]MBV9588755.1 cupin domain-containing protein [Hyphomicrobiales bacterium]MBV9974559.1 cupin domain-containing protein [Hyphomicrobiales bacterium]
MPKLSPDEVIRELHLLPHPEGGWFCESFRDKEVASDGRARSTAIYFLLKAGETSHWHRIDASEIWLWHAGAPLELSISRDGVRTHSHRLGIEIAAGERPQAVVPPHAWQSAKSLGDWTLVSCVVAPGFEFSAFELATPDWRPQQAE